MFGDVEHHDDEHEENHDGAGVDHDFERGHKWCAKCKEVCCDSEQRHDEVQQSVNRMASSDCQQRSYDCYSACKIEKEGHSGFSGHKAMNVVWGLLVLGLPLVLAANGDACDLPKVVIGIFAWTIDHEVRFLVNKIVTFVFAHLCIWR